MVAAEGVVEWLQAVFWRRQSVSLVAINCEPGQVRKEAAVTSPAWVVVQPLTHVPDGDFMELVRHLRAGRV